MCLSTLQQAFLSSLQTTGIGFAHCNNTPLLPSMKMEGHKNTTSAIIIKVRRVYAFAMIVPS